MARQKDRQFDPQASLEEMADGTSTPRGGGDGDSWGLVAGAIPITKKSLGPDTQAGRKLIAASAPVNR